MVVDDPSPAGAGDNALQLEPLDDIVRVFGGLSSGSFSFTSDVYIPPAQAGNYYYLILNRYVSGGAKNWSAQIHFTTSTGMVTADNVTVAGVGLYAGVGLPAVPIVFDSWVEVEVVVDFGATWTGTGGATGTGTYDAFYNGVQVVDGAAWFGAGGQLEMEAIDLYNDGGGTFYYDNVQVDCLANCVDDLPADRIRGRGRPPAGRRDDRELPERSDLGELRRPERPARRAHLHPHRRLHRRPVDERELRARLHRRSVPAADRGG
jgi:hypothetical protein